MRIWIFGNILRREQCRWSLHADPLRIIIDYNYAWGDARMLLCLTWKSIETPREHPTVVWWRSNKKNRVETKSRPCDIIIIITASGFFNGIHFIWWCGRWTLALVSSRQSESISHCVDLHRSAYGIRARILEMPELDYRGDRETRFVMWFNYRRVAARIGTWLNAN